MIRCVWRLVCCLPGRRWWKLARRRIDRFLPRFGHGVRVLQYEASEYVSILQELA